MDVVAIDGTICAVEFICIIIWKLDIAQRVRCILNLMAAKMRDGRL